jgi:tetratricopeptide (TPR) repeat protein
MNGKEEALFAAALEIPDPLQRAAFLDRACGGDPDLRRSVESLLSAYAAGSFLESPAVVATTDEAAGAAASATAGETAGSVIGPYRLLEQIGEGGMGTVWLAEQTQPLRRMVALKVIRPGMGSAQVIARFEAERQALALMDHPNIARVLDAGTTEGEPGCVGAGRPYFVMELIRGVPITDYCDQNRLSLRERLELFVAVCRAVQHAHQKGIIHRDLKPSNVLVALHDGKAVVKVIDFGIAKALGQALTDRPAFTGQAQMVGTPLYMSPEQAGMGDPDIDTRSDIYSLGVLLYELLSGTTPFDAERLKQVGLDELCRIIRDEEPPRPSVRISTMREVASNVSANRQSDPRRLSQQLRGELDWIVMKCLDKDRNRRYETANGLARDVERYLLDEPVLACPPSAWYRIHKFARRNKVALAVTSLMLFFLLVLGGGMGWVVRDRAARHAALEQEVTRALAEAEDFYKRGKLPDGMAALKRAEGLLASGEAGVELRRRVRQWRTDLGTAMRLEQIRLDRCPLKGEEPVVDWRAADTAYRDEFRAYGLDVEALDPDEAAARIRASTIKDRLVAALDDWVLVKLIGKLAGPERLLVLARRADPHPWRDRLRDVLGRRRWKALKRLARDRDAQAQPPATVVLLTEALFGPGMSRPLAVEVLRQAQQRHPGDYWINERLGYFLLQLEPAQPGEAARFFQAALALRPDDAAMHHNLGFALEKQGRPAEAEAEFREAIGLRPNSASSHHSLGFALASQDRPAEAEAAYREAIRLKPDFANCYKGLGLVLQKQGKWAEAVAATRKAIRLKPGDPEAYVNLGTHLCGMGHYVAGEDQFREAIRLKPDHVNAHVDLGVALRHQGKLAEAAAALRHAIGLKRNEPMAHYNLGLVLSDQQKWAEAEAAYRVALRLQPGFANAHLALANDLYVQDKLADAEAEAREAIRLERDNGGAHNNLGGILAAQSKWADAEAEFREALRLMPGDRRARANLNVVLRRQGKPAEMDLSAANKKEKNPADKPAQGKRAKPVAALREVLRRTPDDPEGCRDLAWTLREAGRAAEAVALLEQLLPKLKVKPGLDDPLTVRIMVELGVAYHQAGRTADAVRLLEKALKLAEAKLGPDDWETDLCRSSLGLAYSDAGRTTEAIRLLEEMLKGLQADVGPDHPNALLGLNNLGHAYIRAGLFDRALPLHERAVAKMKVKLGHDHPETLRAMTNLAVDYESTGQLDRAIPLSEQTLKLKTTRLGPDHLDTLTSMNNLAVVYQAAGKLDRAVPLFEQTLAKRKARLGPDHPETLTSMNNLAFAYELTGKLARAETLERQLLELRRKKDDPGWLATTLAGLGLTLQRRQKYAEAERLVRDSLAIRQKKEPNAWTTFSARSVLGAALLGQKKYAAAEPLLLKGYAGLKQRQHNIDVAFRTLRLTQALDRLVRLYDAWGKKDEAARWRKEHQALVRQAASAHFNQGRVFLAKGNVEGALAAFRQATAINPRYAEAHSNLGVILLEYKKDNDGAIAAFRQAIAADPRFPEAHKTHYNLGQALFRKGDWVGAMTAYRQAVACNPKDALAHYALGYTLDRKGNVDAAIASYRNAIAADPRYAWAHYNLGHALFRKGDRAGAIAAYRKAVAFNSGHAEAHCNLGHALREEGRFAEALAELKKGHELGSRRPKWPYASAGWVAHCQRLVELDARLPAILKGEARAKDWSEQFEFARLCSLKRLTAAAARLYQEGLTAYPERTGFRYPGALAAALAGCGQGKDATALGEGERARWRKQALAWLRADLELQRKHLQGNSAQARKTAQGVLESWKRQPDFAGLRDRAALARLPAAEQQAWQKLWAEVEALLQQARKDRP